MVRSDRVNAYLIDDGGALTLVDAGKPWDGHRLVLGIDDTGYAIREIHRVLLTHFDVDHVGGLGRLHGLDATVYVGRDDAPFVRGTDRPPLRNRKGALQALLQPLVEPPSCQVEAVADGEEVGSFTVYHTPGHTPGHVAYVSSERSVGFLGDLVRERDGEFRPSPWPLSYDADAVRESIRDLAARVPAFEVAGTGHRVPFKRGGSERLQRLAASL